MSLLDERYRSIKYSDFWIYILIACVWGVELLKLSNAVALRIPGLDRIGENMYLIITYFVAFFALPGLLRKLKSFDIIFVIGIFMIYILQYFFYPENTKLLDDFFFEIIIVTVPAYFVGCALDIKKVDKMLFVISLLCLALFLFQDFFYGKNTDNAMEVWESKQYKSYALLPYAIYSLWYTCRNFNIIGFISVFIGLLLIFSYGSRGPLVCYLAFFIGYFFVIRRFKHRIIVTAVIFFLSVLMIFFSETLMRYLVLILEELGMSTRLVDFFLNGNFGYSDDRQFLIDRLISILNNEQSIMGYGILGSWRYIGVYSHRLYIDFWFSFGYIIGSVLLLVLAVVLFIGYKSSKSEQEKGFWLLLFCVSVIHLMFSQFFLTNVHFFLFLGYCMNRMRYSKQNYIY